MANGTIAFDTLQTSGQITGTAKSVDTDYVVNGSAKAWVQGDTGANIEDSLNVTSSTDAGTGDYSYTMSNSMENNDYSQQVSCNGGELCAVKNITLVVNQFKLITYTRASSFTAADQRHYVVIIGDLA